MRSKVFQRILDEYKKLPWYKKLKITLIVEWHTLKCMGVWNYLFFKPKNIRRKKDIDDKDEFMVCPECGDESDDGSKCTVCEIGFDRF